MAKWKALTCPMSLLNNTVHCVPVPLSASQELPPQDLEILRFLKFLCDYKWTGREKDE